MVIYILDPVNLAVKIGIISEKFNLVNNFLKCVLELWYFTCVFFMIRPFPREVSFMSVTLTFKLSLRNIFANFFENFAKTVRAIVYYMLYFTWIFLVMKYFCWYKPFDIDNWYIFIIQIANVHNLSVIYIRASIFHESTFRAKVFLMVSTVCQFDPGHL